MFKITYRWERRSDPWLSEEEEFTDVTPLFLGLQHFLSLYNGRFEVQIDNLTIPLDFDPDLSTIFNELPDVLEHLTSEKESPIELDFFEEGTALCWILERSDEVISVRLIKGSDAGTPYKDLPDKTFWVEANLFLSEWIYFIKVVLVALTELQPNLIEEESYQEYTTRLTNLNPK